MARGAAFTNTEKLAIEAMLEKKYTVSKMANTIKKSESAIAKYIKENLSQTKKLMDIESGYMSKEVEKEIFNRLIACRDSRGQLLLTEVDAAALIKKVKSKLTEEVTMDKVEVVVQYCLNKPTVQKLFNRQAEGGRKGVVVMTQQASEHLDSLRGNRKIKDNSSHIFKQEDAVNYSENDDV